MKILMAVVFLASIWPVGMSAKTSMKTSIWPFGPNGKDFQMTSSPNLPAATGTVHVSWDNKNRNTKLDIKVESLAPAASLTPPENVYVVWVQPRNEQAVKEGAIEVDQDRKGELKTVTTSKDFNVFITAEKSVNVTSPSNRKVLNAHISP